MGKNDWPAPKPSERQLANAPLSGNSRHPRLALKPARRTCHGLDELFVRYPRLSMIQRLVTMRRHSSASVLGTRIGCRTWIAVFRMFRAEQFSYKGMPFIRPFLSRRSLRAGWGCRTY